ncbi:MAG: pantetheine-phosphate adenylyltransferase [Nitrospina sp.]|jgi:pantetheine-phosphate adenylyltransferase|nr:pantetheine-phosphate adenylyltransferase [Nitrospina sp.]MBT5258639.1 pantetheine-phosphate adenylyltransferase [Nitrospina sp.]MBT5968757.1 pantetheine-phosphate adenylyltransferase [Nitrospina sp.]MBT7520952.1 pantetheine-phosphate adenylyltransferase [Nitrospina sp.]|tara:strand:+ start:1950 stop:2435 length:486 start_codon:yes stop_codon:yes gene_type:complete
MSKKKIAIYPGTFDPVTNGHIDIINRSLNLFDHLIVSVALNPKKNPTFSIDQRVNFIKKGLKGLKNVEVLPFDNLLTDFAQFNDASVIIKGLRAISDFEYELQMGLMNRNLDQSIETLFMIPSLEYSFLSSSFIKEIAKHGGDIHKLVPTFVAEKLLSMNI